MALTDSSNMFMPVAPAGGYGNGFGGDCWWIIVLLFALGWGNNGFGGNGNDFPWLMSGQSDGFKDTVLNDNITSVRDGVAALSNQLCNNQIADMERSFAAQTASTQGMTAIQAQLCNGFSNQAAAAADVKYTIATEACANRATSTANTQAILDKLCQLELDGYKRENDQLRSQLQLSQIQNAQAAEVDALYNRLSNCPIPSTPVYGRTPIFTCGGGCGCNGIVA